jgi:alkanesulfonate monooxygenase SsuD/methylene tetrahydromethanopterin reductase-like flavin-dependent oxidoreductase (luciferase family)
MTFKVGAQILTYGATWDEALETVRWLDDAGYTYIWGHDHLYSTGGNPYQGFFEGWTTLAAWAQATSRARLGLLVGANTFRNPGVVAKMAVTIDHASHGRSILGLGAGNMAFEAQAHGIDPGRTMGERMDWFEESLAIVVTLLAGEEVTHHSDKYQFEAVRHAPGPVQARIPVVIGAEGEKRGLKLVARYADIWQWFAPFDGVATFRHKDEVLRAHAADEGRDAATIERMLGAKLILRSDPDEAQRVAEELVAIHKWGPSVWDSVWATTPERAADRLAEFVEAGAHSFSPQIGWPYDRETIERLIGEVVPAVEASVAQGKAGKVPEG